MPEDRHGVTDSTETWKHIFNQHKNFARFYNFPSRKQQKPCTCVWYTPHLFFISLSWAGCNSQFLNFNQTENRRKSKMCCRLPSRSSLNILYWHHLFKSHITENDEKSSCGIYRRRKASKRQNILVSIRNWGFLSKHIRQRFFNIPRANNFSEGILRAFIGFTIEFAN